MPWQCISPAGWSPRATVEQTCSIDGYQSLMLKSESPSQYGFMSRVIPCWAKRSTQPLWLKKMSGMLFTAL